jgi:hypothetical protein
MIEGKFNEEHFSPVYLICLSIEIGIKMPVSAKRRPASYLIIILTKFPSTIYKTRVAKLLHFVALVPNGFHLADTATCF